MEAALADGGGQQYAAIIYRQFIGADDIDLSAEATIDLLDWMEGPTYLGRTNNGDGTSSGWFVSDAPVTANDREFLRVEVATKP